MQLESQQRVISPEMLRLTDHELRAQAQKLQIEILQLCKDFLAQARRTPEAVEAAVRALEVFLSSQYPESSLPRDKTTNTSPTILLASLLEIRTLYREQQTELSERENLQTCLPVYSDELHLFDTIQAAVEQNDKRDFEMKVRMLIGALLLIVPPTLWSELYVQDLTRSLITQGFSIARTPYGILEHQFGANIAALILGQVGDLGTVMLEPLAYSCIFGMMVYGLTRIDTELLAHTTLHHTDYGTVAGLLVSLFPIFLNLIPELAKFGSTDFDLPDVLVFSVPLIALVVYLILSRFHIRKLPPRT